jgi:hypothetical protein
MFIGLQGVINGPFKLKVKKTVKGKYFLKGILNSIKTPLKN